MPGGRVDAKVKGMELKLDIPSELEPTLRKVAEQEGVEPEQWANMLVARHLRSEGSRPDGLSESDRLRQSALARVARLDEAADETVDARQYKSSDFTDCVVSKLKKQGFRIEN